MSGYYQMARGWMDNDFFDKEPFTEREAWLWLIEQASWKPSRVKIKGTMVEIKRGQLSFAQRFLAEKWQWSKSRVDRFLKRLTSENMIETCSKNGATAGHSAGQGQSVITICNYDKYQALPTSERGNDEQQSGATAGQQRGKEEEEKENKKKENTDYAFAGRTIRLSHEHFDGWQRAYSAIPDLVSELQALDDWISDQPSNERKGWFFRTSGALKNKNADYLARAKERELGSSWEQPC